MNTPVIPCPPRVIVIDDNPAIHDDFRKILCPQASDRAADQLEADIFGERVDTGLPPERYDLETALQGQEGLEKNPRRRRERRAVQPRLRRWPHAAGLGRRRNHP